MGGSLEMDRAMIGIDICVRNARLRRHGEAQVALWSKRADRGVKINPTLWDFRVQSTRMPALPEGMIGAAT